MITLIGCEQAKKGNGFIFQKAADECETCRLKNTCINTLENGRKYIIKDVKSIEHKCPINESPLVTVEVELADIEMLIDARKVFEGSNFTYIENDCTNNDCENYKLCHPEGIHEGDKITIAKDLRLVPDCSSKKILKKIIVRI